MAQTGDWRPANLFVIPDIDKLKHSLLTKIVGVIKNIVKLIALPDSYNL